MNRYIFLDVETTGLSPHKGDRIIELGCVEVIDGNLTGRIFHSYFKINTNIGKEAFSIHGIDNNFLKNKPLFKDILDDFYGFINNSIIIAHNAKFDINFLHYEINNAGGKISTMYKICYFLDSLELTRKIFPRKKNDLDSLCKRYNLYMDEMRLKHSALIDAWLLSLLIIKIGFFGKQENVYC
ncbi:MAG: exonuclease domain-containing protein [Candidatus Carsonella ruddii]